MDDDSDFKDVPLSMRRVESLIEHHFSSPRPIPVDVVVGLKVGQNILESTGKLYVVSPIEFSHAFLIATHRSLAHNDEPILEGWRNAALMTPFVFKVCEGEDRRHFMAKQLREDFGANYVGVRQSALAKIFELIKFKSRKESTSGALTSKQISEFYQQNV